MSNLKQDNYCESTYRAHKSAPWLKIVDDNDGNVSIGLMFSHQVEVNPGQLFIDIMDLVATQPLALRGSETRALAFLISTASRGLLWFYGHYKAEGR